MTPIPAVSETTAHRRVAPFTHGALLDNASLLVIAKHAVNILIDGVGADVEALLAEIRPCLRRPCHDWPIVPTAADRRPATVIVRDAAGLSFEEYARLQRLTARPRTQLVTVSPVPLYERVESGAFPADLYYRLNVVRISRHGGRDRFG